MLVFPQLRRLPPSLSYISYISEWDQCGICGEQSGICSRFLYPPYRRPPSNPPSVNSFHQCSIFIHSYDPHDNVLANTYSRSQTIRLQAVFRTLPLRANAPNLLPARKCEQFAVTPRRQKRGQGQLLKGGSRLRLR